MRLLLVALLALPLTGCAAPPVQAQAQASVSPASPTAQSAAGAGFDLAQLPIAKLAHEDLKAAAAYATSNGYPARAAVYTAIEAQLTACEAAITAAAPKIPSPGTVGFFTAFEVAAEAVGTGIPTSVKLNCSAIQIPGVVLAR